MRKWGQSLPEYQFIFSLPSHYADVSWRSTYLIRKKRIHIVIVLCNLLLLFCMLASYSECGACFYFIHIERLRWTTIWHNGVLFARCSDHLAKHAMAQERPFRLGERLSGLSDRTRSWLWVSVMLCAGYQNRNQQILAIAMVTRWHRWKVYVCLCVIAGRELQKSVDVPVFIALYSDSCQTARW